MGGKKIGEVKVKRVRRVEARGGCIKFIQRQDGSNRRINVPLLSFSRVFLVFPLSVCNYCSKFFRCLDRTCLSNIYTYIYMYVYILIVNLHAS